MQTGDYIRFLRTGNNQFGKKMTQAELGAALNPPVNRAAINKWESGMIKTIKKVYIQQIADIFGVTPTEIMCFESKYDEMEISEEVKVIEQIQMTFGKDFVKILQHFNELNEEGKQKAIETIIDLTEHPKYTNKINQNYDC